MVVMCDRGLLTVTRGEDRAHIQVTEAGTLCLRNGRHLDDPAHGRRATGNATDEAAGGDVERTGSVG